MNVPLEDHVELSELSFRYASGVDRRDVSRFTSVFRADSTLEVHREGGSGGSGMVRSGLDQIGAVVERLARYDSTFHHVGNRLFEVEGDRATGEVYCVARHLTLGAEGGTDLVMFVRYEDAYRRDRAGDAWWIHHRMVNILWTEAHTVQP